jgi:hypothetical protein
MNFPYKESDLVWEWERSAFPYYLYIFNSQWLDNDFSPTVYSALTFENGRANCYLYKKSLEYAGKEILRKVKLNNRYFFDWSSYVYKTADDLNRLCDHLANVDFTRLSDLELLSLFRKMFLVYKNHNSNVGIIRNTNRELQLQLGKILPNNNLLATLLSTNKKSIFSQEHEDLLIIVDKLKHGDEVTNLLKQHAKKYFYLPLGYYGEKAYSFKDFKERLNDILSNKKLYP